MSGINGSTASKEAAHSKICASHYVIWACKDLVPQTWVIKPTMFCFVAHPTANCWTDTTDRMHETLSEVLFFHAQDSGSEKRSDGKCAIDEHSLRLSTSQWCFFGENFRETARELQWARFVQCCRCFRNGNVVFLTLLYYQRHTQAHTFSSISVLQSVVSIELVVHESTL